MCAIAIEGQVDRPLLQLHRFAQRHELPRSMVDSKSTEHVNIARVSSIDVAGRHIQVPIALVGNGELQRSWQLNHPILRERAIGREA